MEYAKNDLIRLYPNANDTFHYTGVVLDGGRLLQVKPLNDKNHNFIFYSIDTWIKGIPHEKKHVVFSKRRGAQASELIDEPVSEEDASDADDELASEEDASDADDEPVSEEDASDADNESELFDAYIELFDAYIEERNRCVCCKNDDFANAGVCSTTLPTWSGSECVRGSTAWANYIKYIIGECNHELFNKPDLCDEFNRFYTLLNQYKDHFFTVYPSRDFFYEHIALNKGASCEANGNLPITLHDLGNDIPPAEYTANVLDAYKRLYTLLEKYGVVKYVRRKGQQTVNRFKTDILRAHANIAKCILAIQKYETMLEHNKDCLEQLSDTLQQMTW